MSGTVPFNVNDNVSDTGTTASVGRAVAVAAAAAASKSTEVATENGLGGLYGGCWEEGKSTRFGCEWGLLFEAILSFNSAVVVVS